MFTRRSRWRPHSRLGESCSRSPRSADCSSAPPPTGSSVGRAARRAAVRCGRIGEPIAASAFIAHSQVERWHPDPTIFFLRGAGPVFDLGPYYLSALIDCLGRWAVAALERIRAPTRTVTAPNRAVDRVKVEVPTHSAAILEFASGVIANLTMSFDAWERTMPFIEIYGAEGHLLEVLCAVEASSRNREFISLARPTALIGSSEPVNGGAR